MLSHLPLVFGPLLAMDTMPRLECFSWSTISSGNLPVAEAKMDLPPFPVPVGSPPCVQSVGRRYGHTTQALRVRR